MSCTHNDKQNGTRRRKTGTINSEGKNRKENAPYVYVPADGTVPDMCPHCRSTRLCVADSEVCCTGCGAVVGRDYMQQEEHIASKINLYQAVGIGTRSVDLERARYISDDADTSCISNMCVKLDLPMYAAQDVHVIFKKISKEKHRMMDEYDDSLTLLEGLVKEGLADAAELDLLKSAKPRVCGRAQTAAFAVSVVCKKHSIVRTERRIIDAVRMNFGAKRRFTMLKAYTSNKEIAGRLGIWCDHDTSQYYARLLLGKLRDRIGEGRLYDKIVERAFANLKWIAGSRADVKARRAVDLAVRGARLYVQI